MEENLHFYVIEHLHFVQVADEENRLQWPDDGHWFGKINDCPFKLPEKGAVNRTEV